MSSLDERDATDEEEEGETTTTRKRRRDEEDEGETTTTRKRRRDEEDEEDPEREIELKTEDDDASSSEEEEPTEEDLAFIDNRNTIEIERAARREAGERTSEIDVANIITGKRARRTVVMPQSEITLDEETLSILETLEREHDPDWQSGDDDEVAEDDDTDELEEDEEEEEEEEDTDEHDEEEEDGRDENTSNIE